MRYNNHSVSESRTQYYSLHVCIHRIYTDEARNLKEPIVYYREREKNVKETCKSLFRKKACTLRGFKVDRKAIMSRDCPQPIVNYFGCVPL